MADRDDRKEEKEEQSLKQSSSKSKLPLMLGGGFLVVALLVGGGIFAMKSFSSASSAATDEKAVTEGTEAKGETSSVSSGVFYKGFEPFITVLEPSTEYNFTYLKFVPELEVADEKSLEEVNAKLPALSAVINAVMTDLNWNNVKSEKGRKKLAEKLKGKLNEILGEGKIINVYFTTFVVQ